MTRLFRDFFESEKAGSLVLICCTVVSLLLANSGVQESYLNIWNYPVANHSVSHWINDGLMAIFFLLIGLELEREIYVGELSSLKNALLPMFAALGGMIVPAGIFLLFNYGTTTQAGAGIPMATDIAFAIGVLSLLGKRVPTSLKVFLTALAVIDDLGAILVIAIFYSTSLSFLYLGLALGVFVVLIVFNRLKINSLLLYLIGGACMWYFMLNSGVHATITGVMLAFVIPFRDGGEKSISYRLQHWLHRPVAFFILPLFALANTALVIDDNWNEGFTSMNSLGIFFGLVVGKPLGIFLFSFLTVIAGLTSLPTELRWKDLIGAGFLGGIGFTMSIFITLLAFNNSSVINESKIAILISSLAAGIVGFLLLKLVLKKGGTQY